MEQAIASLIQRLLVNIGEDPQREGLVDTPKRVERMYKELTAGYVQDPRAVAKVFVAESEGDLITVTKIPFYSLCEHHMVPFFGVVHVGYVPDRYILGLSKFARIVDIFARRLQVQERMTAQIADSLDEILQPKGLAVSIRAEHLCMSMRGVSKQGSETYTETVRGLLKDDKDMMHRFYQAVRE